MNKTHWKRLINPDYIGAYALNPGEDLVVTIDSVRSEKVTGSGGKKDECSVARLIGQKPMILNATNSKTIAKLYGPYIEDWAGKKIILYASTTNLAGEMVECLRIRPVQPQNVKAGKQPLPDARFKNALAAIEDGAFSADKLRLDYELTEDQQAALALVEENLKC